MIVGLNFLFKEGLSRSSYQHNQTGGWLHIDQQSQFSDRHAQPIAKEHALEHAGHEHPSIGVLLCASKNDEVVEYALSRSLSPAMISEYQTQLPDKKLLQAKLHEFYLQNAPEARPE